MRKSDHEVEDNYVKFPSKISEVYENINFVSENINDLSFSVSKNSHNHSTKDVCILLNSKKKTHTKISDFLKNMDYSDSKNTDSQDNCHSVQSLSISSANDENYSNFLNNHRGCNQNKSDQNYNVPKIKTEGIGTELDMKYNIYKTEIGVDKPLISKNNSSKDSNQNLIPIVKFETCEKRKYNCSVERSRKKQISSYHASHKIRNYHKYSAGSTIKNNESSSICLSKSPKRQQRRYNPYSKKSVDKQNDGMHRFCHHYSKSPESIKNSFNDSTKSQECIESTDHHHSRSPEKSKSINSHRNRSHKSIKQHYGYRGISAEVTKVYDRSKDNRDFYTNYADCNKKRFYNKTKSYLYRSKGRREMDKREQERRTRRSRRRSSTPKDLPCLSLKAYKYVCSTPADHYYCFKEKDSKEVFAKRALKALHEKFEKELVKRAERVRASKPKYEPPPRKTKLRKPKPPKTGSSSDSSSSECSSSEEEETAMEELERKKKHPYRLHVEMWFNDPKEMNDGPLCRCSAKARRTGIRHGIYTGEDHLPLCDPMSNNVDRLYHYRITMTPHTNFMTKYPTTIYYNDHRYCFEGFSMFSHSKLPNLPNCKVIRFNYEYTIIYAEDDFPKNFTIQGLELFCRYLLIEILELVDINWRAHNDPDGCPRFHFMPRFARELKDGGKELLSHCYVLDYLLKQNQALIDENKLSEMLSLTNHKWQDLADEVKGMIVTCPGMKPSSLRVDQLDREECRPHKQEFPVIVHFGVRPPQLSYAGNPQYQKAWKEYVKYKHLLANKPKVTFDDKFKLMQKESQLQEMRMENDLKRDVTVVVSSKNFYKTGIMSDIIQHAMLLPVLVCHLRFHQSLTELENKLGYEFKDRYLLQLALTHPSYRENFGTNPDHARNSLTNCGLRQLQYGDRRIHYKNTRKRGINTLIRIMSRFGSGKEALSKITHNERLEFLGDAVVEFLSSIHLFYMFSDLEEGGLATYRAAIVQNQHLSVLSEKLELDRFMLYAHGSDLCHDLELRHAMANCFEALMGALFLDSGIEIADKVFSETLFSEPELLNVWINFPPHPLQEQEPGGDRQYIASLPLLKKMHRFEQTIGIEFTHIRLLARALTHRSLGYNNITLGSNQRLEFLGDTVLQLVASEYLYKHFPEHHEGHLSLLRSSLVNNRTQAIVCADLGMDQYAIYPYEKMELKPKDKADLLEAFLGALFVDKDLGYCKKFCEVCFFPRLQDFIINQDWNDPKSKLQQCCLTLRSMDGGEPEIPTYKVIESKRPTNTRIYSVAVYFQGKRLAAGTGHSIQNAEMDAADNALKKSKDLFPQLRHQRRAIESSLKKRPPYKSKH